ncbi:TonB family protein [Dysgonomonas sp. Marseille-P4677]|uniref:energy transducer TonB n=1 Tax=Dysgonomonas sp. Marseille-P4677 TaxID=2364790 RepID=UPI001912FC5F|nr:energy transducer TonB [Dysgonomonas sp. Marseille-P4677]MBK5721588.1 TonB family protein [Dysgonomonas sp. Marseille-P4677]
MKEVLLFFLLSVNIFCYAQNGSLSKDKIYIATDIMPQFPGGEQVMYKFIKERQIYPQSAIKANVEGRVIARFTVRADGSITNVHIIRGIHPDCDSLVVDIIKAMPRWEWGKDVENIKDTYFTLPVVFRMPIEGITDGERILLTADQMPSYPGGEQAMFKFLRDNLKWTEDGTSFQGRVIVRFIVTKQGKIVKPTVVRGLTNTSDKEALRVVSMMPDWIPGKYNKENVNVYYTIPIVFKLSH